MRDTFNILNIERYKQLGNLLVGIQYSEANSEVKWNLICKGTCLDDVATYLKSHNVECLFKKGEMEDEVKVSVEVSEEIKMFAGSYIPKEIEELYDDFYVKIKDCIEEVKDYAS